MDEALVRISLIAGALMVALVVTLVIRLRGRGQPVEVKDAGLDPGLYLFTSSACQGCRSARRHLREKLGRGGFTEFAWEQTPDQFHRLEVTGVPATLVVQQDSTATLYPGHPTRALRAFGP